MLEPQISLHAFAVVVIDQVFHIILHIHVSGGGPCAADMYGAFWVQFSKMTVLPKFLVGSVLSILDVYMMFVPLMGTNGWSTFGLGPYIGIVGLWGLYLLGQGPSTKTQNKTSIGHG